MTASKLIQKGSLARKEGFCPKFESSGKGLKALLLNEEERKRKKKTPKARGKEKAMRMMLKAKQ